uniref:Uncharacterized protein n=1 Tax=Myotis myotis TaxID=51298 RepID=A0A7J7QYX0_MYOMY|nr:hypothetical protein mMyoMyo1_011262 [Myotis myotis]
MNHRPVGSPPRAGPRSLGFVLRGPGSLCFASITPCPLLGKQPSIIPASASCAICRDCHPQRPRLPPRKAPRPRGDWLPWGAGAGPGLGLATSLPLELELNLGRPGKLAGPSRATQDPSFMAGETEACGLDVCVDRVIFTF